MITFPGGSATQPTSVTMNIPVTLMQSAPRSLRQVTNTYHNDTDTIKTKRSNGLPHAMFRRVLKRNKSKESQSQTNSISLLFRKDVSLGELFTIKLLLSTSNHTMSTRSHVRISFFVLGLELVIDRKSFAVFEIC